MTDKWNERLILHAIIGMTVGLTAGVFYIFALTNGFFILGSIGIGFDLPGRVEAWRAAHLGGILNGMLALGFAFVLSRLELTPAARSRVGKCLLVTVYGNLAFYLFALGAPNRGLSLGDNLHGEGNLMGILSYVGGVAAMIAIYIAVYTVGMAAYRKLSGASAPVGSAQAAE